MSRMLALLTALTALPALACVSAADTRLNATRSVYPISLSRSIVDEQGRVYQPREDEIVGNFRRYWRQWDWLWATVPINGNADLGRIVASEIEKRQGDAVVNLRVRADFGRTWYLTSFFLVFPESVGVRIEGDVVRRNPGAQ